MAPTPRQSWSDHSLDELNKKVDDGFDGVEQRIGRVETKVDALDKKVGDIDKKVDALDRRAGTLETKLGALEKKVDEGFGRMDRDMRELRDEMKNLTRGLFTAAVAIVVAMIGSMATLVGIAFL